MAGAPRRILKDHASILSRSANDPASQVLSASADDLSVGLMRLNLALCMPTHTGISMDEIVKDFLIESRENLDRLDQELVSLESDPTSKELLGSIFRTIHTIKGSCGFLGFARLQKVAHAGENLLSKLRDGVLPLDAEITSGLLAMVDAVRHMLDEIQTGDSDGENEYPELLDRLKCLQTCNPAARRT